MIWSIVTDHEISGATGQMDLTACIHSHSGHKPRIHIRISRAPRGLDMIHVAFHGLKKTYVGMDGLIDWIRGLHDRNDSANNFSCTPWLHDIWEKMILVFLFPAVYCDIYIAIFFRVHCFPLFSWIHPDSAWNDDDRLLDKADCTALEAAAFNPCSVKCSALCDFTNEQMVRLSKILLCSTTPTSRHSAWPW